MTKTGNPFPQLRRHHAETLQAKGYVGKRSRGGPSVRSRRAHPTIQVRKGDGGEGLKRVGSSEWAEFRELTLQSRDSDSR